MPDDVAAIAVAVDACRMFSATCRASPPHFSYPVKTFTWQCTSFDSGSGLSLPTPRWLPQPQLAVRAVVYYYFISFFFFFFCSFTFNSFGLQICCSVCVGGQGAGCTARYPVKSNFGGEWSLVYGISGEKPESLRLCRNNLILLIFSFTGYTKTTYFDIFHG